jgi:hypothetical protein
VRRAHLPLFDHRGVAADPALFAIRVRGHLGATVLSAFAELTPHWQGDDTVLTGPLDRSALYGVLAEAEALGLDLLEVRRFSPIPGPTAPGDGRAH